MTTAAQTPRENRKEAPRAEVPALHTRWQTLQADCDAAHHTQRPPAATQRAAAHTTQPTDRTESQHTFI